MNLDQLRLILSGTGAYLGGPALLQDAKNAVVKLPVDVKSKMDQQKAESITDLQRLVADTRAAGDGSPSHEITGFNAAAAIIRTGGRIERLGVEIAFLLDLLAFPDHYNLNVPEGPSA